MDKQIIEVAPSPKETQIAENAKTLEGRVKAITVWDEESAAEATDLAKLVSTQIRMVEDERKAMVKPLNDHVKYINARFKKYSDPLGVVLAEVKNKILGFQKEQRAIAERQAEVARQEAEQLRREAEQAHADGVPAIDISEPTPSQVTVVAGPVRGTFGTTSISKRWTWEVVDFALVPDQYKAIASGPVTAAVRDGAREIPGIRIFEAEGLSLR